MNVYIILINVLFFINWLFLVCENMTMNIV